MFKVKWVVSTWSQILTKHRYLLNTCSGDQEITPAALHLSMPQLLHIPKI